MYFYPRSPCGERPNSCAMISRLSYFYPRSPCGERHPADYEIHGQQQFLSTLSLRRATGGAPSSSSGRIIFLSTLSLRRATTRILLSLALHKHFYPRSPCGERPRILLSLALHKHFYPRSPCGERRPEYFLAWHCISISIHALLAESDQH